MKNFFKSLAKGLGNLGKTALKNAIVSPRTTLAGVTGIVGSIGAFTAADRTSTSIAGAAIGLLGSVALILADDPKGGDFSDEKPTDK